MFQTMLSACGCSYKALPHQIESNGATLKFFLALQAQNTKSLAGCYYLIQSSVQHCIPTGYTQRGGKADLCFN